MKPWKNVEIIYRLSNPASGGWSENPNGKYPWAKLDSYLAHRNRANSFLVGDDLYVSIYRRRPSETRGPTRTMPKSLRNFLSRKNIDVTEIFAVDGLKRDQMEEMERLANRKGKTIFPIATNPRYGFSEIVLRDAAHTPDTVPQNDEPMTLEPFEVPEFTRALIRQSKEYRNRPPREGEPAAIS